MYSNHVSIWLQIIPFSILLTWTVSVCRIPTRVGGEEETEESFIAEEETDEEERVSIPSSQLQ